MVLDTLVCPVCASPEIYYEVGGSTGKIYHCKNCGYVGAFIIEANEKMIDAIKEEYEQKKR